MPERSITYLVKFQRGGWLCSLMARNTGLASAPVTAPGAIMVKVTPKFLKQTVAASASESASCRKSSLAKPTTTSPFSEYCLCRASSPSNCPVYPQRLAVLTTSMGLPAARSQRFTVSVE